MDFAYLSNLLWSFVGTLAMFALIYEMSGSLLRSTVFPLCAFCVTFTLLFIVAHKREFRRYYLRKRRSATKARISGKRYWTRETPQR